jgi:hypothetical protein
VKGAAARRRAVPQQVTLTLSQVPLLQRYWYPAWHDIVPDEYSVPA